MLAVLLVVVPVLVSRRRVAVIVAACMAAGIVTAGLESAREAALSAGSVPSGRVTLAGVAISDPRGSGAETSTLVDPHSIELGAAWYAWDGPLILIRGPTAAIAGEHVAATGSIDPGPGEYRGRPIGGVMSAPILHRIRGATNPLLAVGNLLRRRVLGSLDAAARHPEGALLSGFLIGDVSRLPSADADALRASGLSHFVAVSGSNVALFLGAWWLVGGRLAYGPRRRAVYGLVGLSVFAVVTRWEPSVVRASLMAGLVLVARLVGRPITPWTALGGAVGLALAVAPGLADDVGFSLSVAATAGIITGAPLWVGRRPVVVWAVLGATVSAQLAVAPLLLVWFGSLPLLAPVSNLLAAPLVAAATSVGGVGALLGWDPLVTAGTVLAGLVLSVARTAADLPHLTPAWAVPSFAILTAAIRFRWLRPVALVVVIVATAVALIPRPLPEVPTAYFLDVGQGDATLFRGPAGETVLVDGGPDPRRLQAHLNEYGVRRIDLLIISHRHADHVGGLVGLEKSVTIGMIWHPSQLGEGSDLDVLVRAAGDAGIPALVPEPRAVVRLGSFVVEVRGPVRRYASPNDGSLVVEVSAMGATVVMAGDIEMHAQSDLGPLRGDVLKVPHQGSATSDLAWLAASAPTIAVISVGPNDFGHPSADVIETLGEVGSIVVRTDVAGTIIIPFDRVAQWRQDTPLASLP